MSRNPFLDLGFPREEAIALHIRSQLAARLEQHIERKGWSQTAAARALKVPQPTISKIVNGNIDRLSIEFLIKLMVRAGLPVGITGDRASTGRSPARRRTGHPSAAAM
jgi:predicted XRE-type DNA-binding protein